MANDDVFPRCKVLSSKDGSRMVLQFMQNGFERSFFFDGEEGKNLKDAVTDAFNNPGEDFIVPWDDKARA